VRRAAPWLVLALGVALCVAGAVVAWRAGGVAGPGSPGSPPTASAAYASELQLSFDGRGWLWSSGRLVGAGVALVGLGLVAGLGGRLLGRRSAGAGGRALSPAVRRVLLVGALGCLLVVTGIVLATTNGWPVFEVVTYTGSYEPLVCPGDPGCTPPAPGVLLDGSQLTGLSLAAAGVLVLAVVAGWLLGNDARADQR